ncbi:hypothetical protein [Pedobacter steynii]|uniref:CarboxypepD_reg-like domain-containing protein n=1 Tax=Pedobacter steynii TaxID=430522 RepID=A0A1D7QGY0_9SPHI|nr:hypothetical protein [Pedobacter steynii]AOM77932.1 hypothetical protein BFS30_12555 [Pedobacter steynii]
MAKYLFLLLISIVPFFVRAQTSVSGTVYDYDNKTFPIQDVIVRNLNSREFSKTKAAGQFSIPAKVGDLLEFSYVGYHTDTLFLIDLKPKTIFLPGNSKTLNEVKIISAKVNPSVLYRDPDAKESKRFGSDGLRGKENNDKAGGMLFNLGYGKMKREREKERILEERDSYETEIRENFNEESIAKLVKLSGQDLKDFMSIYRPSVSLIKDERPFNYTYYIVKAYHSWLKLPSGQRKLSPMPRLKAN